MTGVAERLAEALADRYRIERELGGGGMSRVFLARELGLDRDVVVKVIAAELGEGLSAERFAREVKLAARLQQANIVPVLASGEAAGLPYYTMPFVRGESLRALMSAGKLPSLSERVSILRDVARALAYAHEEGIVHRDIKPENVLLSHGTAMVTDFGIAKAIAAAHGGDRPERASARDLPPATLPQAGGSIGTPAYMAPEQAVGDVVDSRTDLYAWGLLAYELLAGAHPFRRHTTPQTLITAHLTEPPPAVKPSDQVPPALAALVMQCLEKDPARRPPSAVAVLGALDTVTTPPASPPSPPSHEIAPPRPPRRRLTGALVGAAVIVGALALWGLRPRDSAPAPSTDAAANTDQSLAVLPLANLSGDPANDFFGIGLAEEITRAVAKNGVRVIGRVSAAALQAKGLDERAIARELGVGSLLTGTVQRAEGQVRINVSLVSASDGAVRWSEKYDRPLANVFAVQDEIARTVAATLLGAMRPPRGATAGRAETSDPEAHALFLQGMVLFNRRGAPQLQQAIALFERASARDPAYARAQASLAMALAVLPAYVQDSTTPILASAIAAGQRAIAMDSTIAESYAALGYGYSLLGELGRAEASFRRAVMLDSTVASTWGWYALLANRMGDYAAAHERIARARALEPASLIARIWDVQVLIPEGRFAAADSLAASTIALDSTFQLAWVWRANALLALKQAPQAVALLERQVALLSAGRPEEIHGVLAYAYALAGRASDARAMLDTMRRRSGGRLPATGAVAAALEELGDHAGALALLDEGIDRHDVWLVQFPRLPRYDRLRRDPRAAAMLDRLRTS